MPRKLKNKRRTLVRALCMTVIAGCAIFLLKPLLNRFMFFPTRALETTPAKLTFTELTIETPDKAKLHGWLFKNEATSFKNLPLIIVCHGNGGNISHRIDLAASLLQCGCDVLLFDYRGYGKSTGAPTEEGTYIDAETVYTYATAHGYSPTQIIIYGESLGGAVATEIALRKPIKALILQSTFTSIVDMAKHIYPWLIKPELLIGNPYNTKSKLPKITVPVLIMHSRNDSIVPFYMAEENFKAAPAPKFFHELNGDHNDPVYLEPGFIEAMRSFIKFLDTQRLPSF